MDIHTHHDIVARLEIIKSAGTICDYLVGRVGTVGKLEPVVRTWITDGDEIQTAHKRISKSLCGLVSERSITVNDTRL